MSHRGIKEQLWPFTGWFVLFYTTLFIAHFAVLWFSSSHPLWLFELGLIVEGVLAGALAFRLSERKARGFRVSTRSEGDSKKE